MPTPNEAQLKAMQDRNHVTVDADGWEQDDGSVHTGACPTCRGRFTLMGSWPGACPLCGGELDRDTWVARPLREWLGERGHMTIKSAGKGGAA